MTLPELRKVGWTWRVMSRVTTQISNDLSRASRSPWEDSASSIGRILRLLKDRPRKQIRTINRNNNTWIVAAKLAALSLRGDKDRFSQQGTWKAQCHRIAGSLKLRKGCSMSRSVTAKDILKLLESQNYTCAYTGDDLTPDSVSADHLKPLSNGGSHDLENIRLVTRKVNQAKGTMSYDEFVEMCRKVVDHADKRKPDVYQEYQSDLTEDDAWEESQEGNEIVYSFGEVAFEL